MKKRNMNYKGMAIALFFAMFVSASTTVLANDKHKTKSPAAVELKLVGQEGDNPVLELKLANTEEDVFTITFRDNYGNVLYSERMKGSNFNKRFVINTEEVGDDPIKVEVRSKNGNQSEVYTITRNETSVHETVVTKTN